MASKYVPSKPINAWMAGGVNGLRILTLDGSCKKCYRNIQIIFEYPNTKLINYNLVIPYLANVRMATITSTEALTWISLTCIFYHWDIATKCNLFFYLQYTNICRCKQTQKTNILGISICSAKKTKYKAFQDRRAMCLTNKNQNIRQSHLPIESISLCPELNSFLWHSVSLFKITNKKMATSLLRSKIHLILVT